MNPRAPGMSLVELIVALTILAVGVLGLAAAATFAQRSFTSAEAVERGVNAAAAVLDSLMHVPAPQAGTRRIDDVEARWSVAGPELARRITLRIDVHDGARLQTLTFHAVHSGLLAR